ncbi:MAG TPA: hypothetical protein VJ765_08880 [Chitinophagaceae bacterium]|nr:hypothetical protein [Chitinophagaceae bacterium]
MKPLITTTTAFFLIIFSPSAQVIPIRNTLQTDVAKVISDYPNGFKNIIGDELVSNPQTIEFECRASVKDAIACGVIK